MIMAATSTGTASKYLPSPRNSLLCQASGQSSHSMPVRVPRTTTTSGAQACRINQGSAFGKTRKEHGFRSEFRKITGPNVDPKQYRARIIRTCHIYIYIHRYRQLALAEVPLKGLPPFGEAGLQQCLFVRPFPHPPGAEKKLGCPANTYCTQNRRSTPGAYHQPDPRSQPVSSFRSRLGTKHGAPKDHRNIRMLVTMV